MKKIILFAALFVVSTSIFCQRISGGIKAGINTSRENYSNAEYTGGFKTSFAGGLYITLMITKKLGIQPEVLFSSQGGKGNPNIDYQGGHFIQLPMPLIVTQGGNNKFDYLSVPFLMLYQIAKILNFHAGPQLGILMSAKQGMGSSETQNFKGTLNSTDFGLAIGAGVDILKGLNFTARYITGLTNIYKESNYSYNAKNQVIQITAGYKLFGKN